MDMFCSMQIKKLIVIKFIIFRCAGLAIKKRFIKGVSLTCLLTILTIIGACSDVANEATLDKSFPETTVAPSGGLYNNAQKVSLSCKDDGLGCFGIFYTLDGSEPTQDLEVYTGEINVGSNTTLKFFSVDKAGNKEATRTVEYYIDLRVPTVITQPSGGIYNTVQEVELQCQDEGSGCADIYYTVDGTEPNPDSSLFVAGNTIPIISQDTLTVLKLIAFDAAGNTSGVKTQTYLIDPAGNPDTIEVMEGGTVTTVNGDEPSVLLNDSSLEVVDENRIAVLVLEPGLQPSHAASFTLNPDGTFNYTHDDTESIRDQFTYQIQDGVQNLGDPITVTINIAPVNDNAPTVAVQIDDQSTSELANFELTFAVNTFDDIDTDDTLTYSARLLGGALLPTWMIFDPGLRKLSGIPPSDSATTGTGLNIEIIARDNANHEISDVFALSISNTNVPPTAASSTVTTDEDTSIAFNEAVFNYQDLDGNNLNRIRITRLESAGSLKLGTLDIALNDEISVTNINAGNFRFQPGLNANGLAYATFQFSVNDGSDYSLNSYVMTINVTAVNDPPTTTNTSVSTQEDAIRKFTQTDFGFNDVDSNDTLAQILITRLESAGALKLNGTDIVLNTVIPIASLNVGNFEFEPSLNENGIPYATFEFKVHDGTVFSDAPGTITINVSPVNDEPTAADSVITTLEDTNYSFTVGNFNYTDIENNPLNRVEITSLATVGKLMLNAIPIVQNDSINVADLNAGNFSFAPDSNGNGSPYSTFNFRVHDGTDYSVANYTFTVNVTRVNDPPTGANNSVTTDEDVTKTFAPIEFGFRDIDQGDSFVQLQITGLETAGTLQLNGVDVLLNSFIQVANIAAGELTFTPVENANGTGYASFAFKVNDGTVNSNVAYTMTVDVNPVNDPPTISGTPNPSIKSDQLYQFAPVYNDIEGDVLEFSFVNLPSWNTITSNTLTGEITGTPIEADVGAFPNVDICVTDNIDQPVCLGAFTIAVSDGTPPADVLKFSARSGVSQVNLSWVKPLTADYAGVRIYRATTGYLTLPIGIPIYEGVGTVFSDVGLTNGNQYFYSAFAYDTSGNQTKAVFATTTAGSWVDIALGDNHTLALKADGTVWAWGNNIIYQLGNGTITDSAQPKQVCSELGCTAFLTNVVSIAAGSFHSLALKSDGSLWSWGSNGRGELGDGTNISRSLPVRVCDSGQTDCSTNPLSGIKDISAGNQFSLAVKSDGSIWSWGDNQYGQQGNTTSINSNTPVREIQAANDWIAASTGGIHVIAQKIDGTVWAWGSNSVGQIGDGSLIQRNSPVQVCDQGQIDCTAFPMTDVISVVAGRAHSLVQQKDGSLLIWGQALALGDGASNHQNIPVKICANSNCNTAFLDAADIDAGGSYSFARMDDSTLFVWGGTGVGAMGLGLSSYRKIPVQVGFSDTWVRAGAGSTFSVAIQGSGQLWSWGDNKYGQLGIGLVPPKKLPVQLGIETDWALVDAGRYLSQALKSDGTRYAWGRNSSGQLGNGTQNSEQIPIPINSVWTSVSTGDNHVIGIKDDGTLWGWGINYSGELGATSSVYVFTPVQIDLDSDWKSTAVGYQYSIALKTTGEVFAWGVNNYGQLGNGTLTNSSTRVQVCADFDIALNVCNTYLTGVVAIATGALHSLALRNDNTVWSWGYNSSGQLGNGTNINSVVANFAGITGVTMISAGYTHSLALKLEADGTSHSLWAWGNDGYGQLGSEFGSADQLSPVPVGIDTDWVMVKGGNYHTVALKSNETLWAWGYNRTYQLGIGTDITQTSPVQVCLTYSTQCDTYFTGVSSFSAFDHTVAIKNDGTLWAWGDNSYGQLGDNTAWRTEPALITVP